MKSNRLFWKKKDHKDKLAKTHKQWNVLFCDGTLSETLWSRFQKSTLVGGLFRSGEQSSDF